MFVAFTIYGSFKSKAMTYERKAMTYECERREVWEELNNSLNFEKCYVTFVV